MAPQQGLQPPRPTEAAAAAAAAAAAMEAEETSSPPALTVATIPPPPPPHGADSTAASSSSDSDEAASSSLLSLSWEDFPHSVARALRSLQEEEEFVDVTLACNSRQFNAHKVILSACSPYFRKLLKVGDMFWICLPCNSIAS